jgi:PST family polysaccharide transporter
MDAWPLFLSGMAIVIYMRVDQFVIMATHGTAETGIYAAAVRLSEIFYVLPTIVATSFFPRWQGLLAQSGTAHHSAVRSAMTAMVVVSGMIALVVSLAAGPFVHLLYDRRYDPAVPVLAIHIWTSVFVSMGILGNQWYLSHNLQSRTLLFTLLGAGANFLINLALVPSMGATGGAIASLGAQMIAAFLADAFSARTRPLFAIKVAALCWPVTASWRRLTSRPAAADQHG